MAEGIFICSCIGDLLFIQFPIHAGKENIFAAIFLDVFGEFIGVDLLFGGKPAAELPALLAGANPDDVKVIFLGKIDKNPLYQ